MVDYILASSSLFEHCVTDFNVGDMDISDHFPVMCDLNLGTTQKIHEYNNDKVNLKPHKPMKWRESARDQFVNEFKRLFTTFLTTVTEYNVLETRKEFVFLYQKAGKCMVQNINNCSKEREQTQPDWWYTECSRAKYIKYNKLRRYRTRHTREDLRDYLNARNTFKNICRAKQQHIQSP